MADIRLIPLDYVTYKHFGNLEENIYYSKNVIWFQIEALQNKLAKVKEEKIHLGATLDELIQTNGQLQMAVEKQREDAEKTSYEYQHVKQAR